MFYDAGTDPYIDQASGALRNLLGFTTAVELEEGEADITTARLTALSVQPVKGDFDLAHLRRVHRMLFSGIYEWAGELRTVEISKGSTRFATVGFLEQAARGLFEELHREKLLAELSYKEYITRLAHYYSEVNILHPFREGNGRTQRAFFTLLAAQTGRRIAWERMDPAENITASIVAYNGDETQFIKMLNNLIEE